jgi:hypothetical protein
MGLRVDRSLDNTLSDSHAVWKVVICRKGSRLEYHNRLSARDNIGLLIETPFRVRELFCPTGPPSGYPPFV